MRTEQGFTLVELMIVVGIVAILSAIGLPSYQNYLQRAALTDMLQTMVPFKTAVEICAIERGGLIGCSEGEQGIPPAKTSRYVSKVTVNDGIITLTGQESLSGLEVTLSPRTDDASGSLIWQRKCTSSNSGLAENCQSQFRFDNMSGEGAR